MTHVQAGVVHGAPIEPARADERPFRILSQVPPGSEAIVASVRGPRALRRRLMDIGLVPGAHVRVLRRAPLGDPVEVSMKGCLLALRREEAGEIFVNEGRHGH